MPNDADQDRIATLAASGNVVDLEAYRNAAQRTADTSAKYVAPSTLVFVIGVLVLFWMTFFVKA